jgi:exodeoxyribonuclease VII large subunit
VVTAVGHQTDFTLADMVADARAATPSAAMELVLPDRTEVLRVLGSIGAHLGKALGRRTRLVRERLYRTEDRLSRAMTDALYERRRALDHAAAKLDALSPLRVLARGYSVARAEDGQVLRRTEEFTAGRRFTLRVSDGDVPAQVDKK